MSDESEVRYPIPGPLPVKTDEAIFADLKPVVAKLSRFVDDIQVDFYSPPRGNQPAQYISIFGTADVLKLRKLLNENIGKLI